MFKFYLLLPFFFKKKKYYKQSFKILLFKAYIYKIYKYIYLFKKFSFPKTNYLFKKVREIHLVYMLIIFILFTLYLLST